MQLTKNFHLAEFAASETAARKGIKNVIPTVYVPNIKALCEQVLQPLRDWARQAIRVTSGYRCPELNKAVGGCATSQHLTGCAADIRAPDNRTLIRWFVWLMDNTHFDQLILERSGSVSWIHVSYCANPRKNRQQVIFT